MDFGTDFEKTLAAAEALTAVGWDASDSLTDQTVAELHVAVVAGTDTAAFDAVDTSAAAELVHQKERGCQTAVVRWNYWMLSHMEARWTRCWPGKKQSEADAVGAESSASPLETHSNDDEEVGKSLGPSWDLLQSSRPTVPMLHQR